MWYLSLKDKSTLLVIYIVLHATAAIFMASAASIVFLVIAVSVSGILYRFGYVYKYVLYFLILSFVIWFVFQFELFGWDSFLQKYYDYVIEKVSLSDTNYSSLDRKLKWQYAINDWQKSPWIGNGPGYGTETYSTGYFNTFLTILADTGIFAFISFLLFFFILFLKINSLGTRSNFFFLISFICLILHSSIYYVYYHEPFWFLIIMVQLLYRRNREETVMSIV